MERSRPDASGKGKISGGGLTPTPYAGIGRGIAAVHQQIIASFQALATQRKYFLDRINVMAYRAETAMTNSLRDHVAHANEARCLLRAIYATEADLLADETAGTLPACLHHLENEASTAAMRKLCDELTSTQTVCARSNLRLVLKLGAPKIREITRTEVKAAYRFVKFCRLKPFRLGGVTLRTPA